MVYSKSAFLPYFQSRKEVHPPFILRLNIIKVKKDDAWNNVVTSDKNNATCQILLISVDRKYLRRHWHLRPPLDIHPPQLRPHIGMGKENCNNIIPKQ